MRVFKGEEGKERVSFLGFIADFWGKWFLVFVTHHGEGGFWFSWMASEEKEEHEPGGWEKVKKPCI
jgi:hypothetical protein